MTRYRKIIIFFLLLWLPVAPAQAADFAVFEWMKASLNSIITILSSCLEAPGGFGGFANTTKTINLLDQGTWVPTGITVDKGKLIKFDWNTRGLEAPPRKYLILYRIDPRFARPQLYILFYDTAGQYASDFHTFLNGQLPNYQANPLMNFSQKIIDYNHYINFVGRTPIPVSPGEVINITLIPSSDFFAGAGSPFPYELEGFTNVHTGMYTIVNNLTNKILYSSATAWCSKLATSSAPSAMVCSGNTYKSTSTDPVIGNIQEAKFDALAPSLPSCAEGLDTKDLTDLCLYDKGRGMKIVLGGQVIKSDAQSFVHSDFTGKDIFYYQATGGGDLDFLTDWQVSDMFVNFSQFMADWTVYPDPGALNAYIYGPSVDLALNFLHFGRYIMRIEIGNGEQQISTQQQENIKLEYAITETATSPSGAGMDVGRDYRVDAAESGYLWLKLSNTNVGLQGAITVNIVNYTGSKWFSEIVYDGVIVPLRAQFNTVAKNFYVGLVMNSSLQRIAKLMLTIYIILYGILFLIGATQVTVTDIVTRVLKVGVIVTLFSPTSWNFFNDNLFNIFVQGSDYLLLQVVNVTSSNANIFGFVDPILDRLTNPRMWALLFIQLLQVHTGLTVFAIITIYGIIIYARAILEVIIGYVIAFLCMSVMISLAPLFIILILFERTKMIFSNWLSTLFSYMIQPTILMIFFLLIDQIMLEQINKAVVRACWDWLIPLEFSLSLNHLGIPLNFSFKLPFLPGIPFYGTKIADIQGVDDILGLGQTYVMVASTSLLFYAYCLMSKGLIDYVSIIISQLTNVMPARQEGNYQRPGNPTESVMSDIGGVAAPVKRAAMAPPRLFKSKIIDQKYKASDAGEGLFSKKPNYMSKLSSGPRHDVGDDKPRSNIEQPAKGGDKNG